MMPVVWLLFLSGAAIGHFALALWLFNRLHAQAWPYRFRQVLERLLLLATLAMPALAALQQLHMFSLSAEWRDAVEAVGWSYGGVCILAALLIVPLWLIPKLGCRVPSELVSNETGVVNLAGVAHATVCGAFPRLCASLPGNEIFHLHVQTKVLKLPRLPPALAGLRIAHLTDLHLTGKVGREFYAEVVRLTNELQPDLIVMTGDIAEKTKCLPWIKPLFERLEARAGKFFILGNHDFLLPDHRELREQLNKAGFVDLAGRCERIEIGDACLLIAGNELPWHGPAPQMPALDATFRLLLAHTPDLFQWAQQQQFDLMLAGHNHGGQIRLPLIGPLVSPSRYGVRYAAGLFREGPTLLHVGRGIGGEHLLRWNCPPELSLLVLEAG